MKRKDHLFLLIKSLSRTEKRFFKIYSSRHVIGTGNKYVDLFDAIDQLDKYDEEYLLEKFKKERFTNRFPVAKAYLYELILKSMNQYHAQNSVHAQLLDNLRSIAFLFDKNLFEHAQRLLNKAKKAAYEYELIALLPEIFSWEKKIMEVRFYSGKKLKDIEALHQKENELLSTILQINQYWLLDATLYYQYNLEGIVRSQKEFKKIENVIHTPLMKMEEEELPFVVRKMYFKIYSTYYFIMRDFENCYQYISKMVSLLEDNPNIIQENPKEYVSSINNLLNMTSVMAKLEETDANLQKLRKMMEDEKFRKNRNLQLKLFESYYYHTINYHRNRRDFVGGLRHIKEIDRGLQDFGNQVNEVGRTMLCYHVFQLSFGAKRFETALEWLERITTHPNPEVHQEIFIFSNILQLPILYNIGNQAELRQGIRKIYAFLKSRKSRYKIESLIIVFIKKLVKLEKEEQFVALMEKLKKDLDLLADDPFERKIFAYFDFRKWLTQEISKLKIRV